MTGVVLSLDVLQGMPTPGPVLVHADLMRARAFVGSVTSRKTMLDDQLAVLVGACDGRPLWSPCFNYDFCGNGDTDLREAKSQVGPMGEYLRNLDRFWRSTDPVFSFCGNGPPIEPPKQSRIEAFGPNSGLGQLHASNGTVLFYGAALRSATILHYAETVSGGPVYRYDKVFPGTLTNSMGVTSQIEYVYHVRPMGMSLDYDWDRIERDLSDADLLRKQSFRGEVVATACSVTSLVDFWVDRLNEEPLYFLDGSTREKVQALGLPPGQRVSLEDFEPSV